MRIFGLIIASLLIFQIHAQEVNLEELEWPGLKEFDQKTIDINKDGMFVLGSWAVANIAVNTPLALVYANKNDDVTKFFFWGNSVWNVVNLGIALPTFLKHKNEIGSDMGVLKALEKSNASQKAYLINMGLDLTYIAGGAYLYERLKSSKGKLNGAEGFGISFMAQGLALFIFDITMAAKHGANKKNFRRKGSSILVQPTGNGIQLKF